MGANLSEVWSQVSSMTIYEHQHIICFEPQDNIADIGEFITLVFEDEAGHEILTQECCIVSIDWLQRQYVAIPVSRG